MTYGITPAGFIPKPQSAIVADITANIQADPLLADLDLSAESIEGRHIQIIAAALAELWELAAESDASRDPDSATFAALDGVSAISGTIREPDTSGTVTLSVTLAPLTTLPAGSIAHVGSQADNRWVTNVDVTNTDVSLTLAVPVLAHAEQAGNVIALSGTITVIATPVTGWVSVTNADDAVPGHDAEKDAELRVRRIEELQVAGTSPVEAVRGHLLELAGVERATVFENTSDDVNADGMPAHSIECMVQATSTDLAIATEIWHAKAGGIATHGTTSTVITDSQGLSQTIKFTRPSLIDVYLDIQVTIDAAIYVGDTALKEAVHAYASANILAGDSVIRAKLIGVIIGLSGVIDVPVLHLDFTSSPVADTNLEFSKRQLANLDTGNMTVSHT